ncbi:FOG: HEAT repeat [hydrothermal vent metagenome]|uniref:FOG: HEAT repeat n=1 Tax=hydrothermal vent metagenome TaxID=652676 RepID=A0A3B1CCH0_9ZZZZ
MENMIIKDIISQHAEEAAFLWLLRDAAVRQPHYDLKDLSALDERVEAHIDGLRIAGDEGWEVCKEVLLFQDSGEVFAASVLAFESGNEDRIQSLKDMVIETPELNRGMISALAWLSYPQAKDAIQDCLHSEKPLIRQVGIVASALHRQNPGLFLKEALADPNPFLRARALKAVGELNQNNLLPEVMANAQDEDANCRFYAAWTGLLLREASTIPILQSFVETGGHHAEQALSLLLRRMRIDEAHQFQRSLAQQTETKRLSVQALGMIGDPSTIDLLFEHMSIPELSRVAGEAFSMVTGLDIAYESLETEWPEGFEAGPTESPDDDDVTMDADEDLCWPDINQLKQWWGKNKHYYKNKTAYLCGKSKTLDGLTTVLKTGFQRQRAAAALELTIRQPDIPLFETRAPARRQLSLLTRDS